MKRKFRTMLIMVLVIMMLPTTATFGASKDVGIMVYLDGYSMSFEVPPVIENGTTLVPMRDIFESLGYSVEWVPEKKVIQAAYYNDDLTYLEGIGIQVGNKKAVMKIGEWNSSIGDYEAKVIEKEMAVAPKIINGKTMVPLRIISEMAGYEVDWDSKYKIIYIMSPDYIPDTISDDQKAINEQYVKELPEPVDSYPGAFQ